MADPINPMVPDLAANDQAIRSAGGAILTGADRKIIKERTREIDPNTTFPDIVREMFNKTDSIEEAQTGDKHEAETKDDQRTRIKLERRLIKFAPSIDRPTERIAISEAGSNARIEDSVKKKIERPFDEYAVIYGYDLMGIPVSNDSLRRLENLIDPQALKGIRKEVEVRLAELLAIVAKEDFHRKILDPKMASSLILRSKYSQYLLDYYSYGTKLPLASLIEIIKELGISHELLKSMYNLETVTLSADTLKIKALEEKKRNEIQALEESLKDRYVQMLLSDNPVNRYTLSAGINSTISKLGSLNVRKEKISDLVSEAKGIAWLKSVVLLKDLHLKRVLSNTKDEFEKISKRIKSYTLRARKLGLRISREGVLWVEAQIEKMALEAAEYKLNLFNSMQSMGYDKEREKDILWITAIINQFKKT